MKIFHIHFRKMLQSSRYVFKVNLNNLFKCHHLFLFSLMLSPSCWFVIIVWKQVYSKKDISYKELVEHPSQIIQGNHLEWSLFFASDSSFRTAINWICSGPRSPWPAEGAVDYIYIRTWAGSRAGVLYLAQPQTCKTPYFAYLHYHILYLTDD